MRTVLQVNRVTKTCLVMNIPVTKSINEPNRRLPRRDVNDLLEEDVPQLSRGYRLGKSYIEVVKKGDGHEARGDYSVTFTGQCLYGPGQVQDGLQVKFVVVPRLDRGFWVQLAGFDSAGRAMIDESNEWDAERIPREGRGLRRPRTIITPAVNNDRDRAMESPLNERDAPLFACEGEILVSVLNSITKF